MPATGSRPPGRLSPCRIIGIERDHIFRSYLPNEYLPTIEIPGQIEQIPT
jgi:hypothetical protein